MKNIILCADDYGQNAVISQGIIHLLEKKRLSATSCLTTFPEWPLYAKWLRPFENTIDIGLHLNLTEGNSLTGLPFFRLPSLIMLSHCLKIDKIKIAAELNAQFDRFVEARQHLPNFIDGHQHIHHLPIIRDIIIDIYQRKLGNKKSYIRSVYSPMKLFLLKHNIIQLTGPGILQKKLIAHEIPHNKTFSGIYNFKYANRYRNIFPQFLHEIQSGGIIMCHPGLEMPRNFEYEYFNSEHFMEHCNAANILLKKFF